MATHFSILAWKIPWTEELDGLQSTGSQSIEREWATKCAHTYIPKLKNIGMPYFITFCLLHFKATVFFTSWRFVATALSKSIIFSNSICILCVSVSHLGNSQQFFSLLFVVLICGQKAMATHSSTLAWKIPWMEEPGRLWSMASLRVGHDWATSLSRFTVMHWRRKWQPTPVFLPGESQDRGGWWAAIYGVTQSWDTNETT